MNQSILQSIKKLLGLDADYTPFDTDIIMHINSVFMVLRQLGVGPTNGYSITGANETWADYIGDQSMYEAVKTYVYLKVRLVFDPPSNSSVIDAMKSLISEYEWRLNVEADGGETNG